MLENTIIAFSTSGAAIWCGGTGVPTLSCCDLYQNAGGDWIDPIDDQANLYGNLSVDPLFCNAAGGDYSIRALSPCAPRCTYGCGLIGAGPVGCGTHDYCIKADGTGDFPTIQSAIDAAVNGDVIQLANGTFSGAGNRDLDFRGKAITLRSASDDPWYCIIDCEGSAATPHRGFYFHTRETSATVVQGITIANGFAPVVGILRQGGGAYTTGSSPAFVHCIFQGNAAESGNGGGVYCASSSRPTFTRCTFSRNVANRGAGAYLQAANIEFQNCTFGNNYGSLGPSSGGGVFCAGASPHIHNSIIAFNVEGDAVACSGLSLPLLTCTDIYGNADGDWTACIAGQSGLNGNLNLDPKFCDAAGDNFLLKAKSSPCRPSYNPECGLIGAWPATPTCYGPGKRWRSRTPKSPRRTCRSPSP